MLYIQFYSIRVHLLYLELQMIGEVCLKFSVSSNITCFSKWVVYIRRQPMPSTWPLIASQFSTLFNHISLCPQHFRFEVNKVARSPRLRRSGKKNAVIITGFEVGA